MQSLPRAHPAPYHHARAQRTHDTLVPCKSRDVLRVHAAAIAATTVVLCLGLTKARDMPRERVAQNLRRKRKRSKNLRSLNEQKPTQIARAKFHSFARQLSHSLTQTQPRTRLGPKSPIRGSVLTLVSSNWRFACVCENFNLAQSSVQQTTQTRENRRRLRLEKSVDLRKQASQGICVNA